MDNEIKIPDNFDDFINSDKSNNDDKKLTIETKFKNERNDWTNKIKSMSNRLKIISDVQELMTDIYTNRQIAVEYYHYLISILSKINKEYRSEWTIKYDYYTYKSQKRFPNEKTKELQILSEISEILQKREAIDNHSKFILDTKNTLDNLIYGIKYRIDIEKIKNGSI